MMTHDNESSNLNGNFNAVNIHTPATSLAQISTTEINSFIEPPSYAEAVFRSFDDADVALSTSSATSASSTSGSEYLKILVTDPRNEVDHVSYLIATWTNIKEFGGTEFSVRRRFRDVVMLSERLRESYRGYFVPMRPDKSVVEGQVMNKDEFVETRRLGLEKYLRKLAAHPVIRNGLELRVFLEGRGDMDVKSGDRAVGEVEVVDKGKGAGNVVKMFKELRQSVTYGWGGTKPPLVEEDKEFLNKRLKLQEFETQLSNVSLQAESLVKAQQDIGETMGELGLAFVKLTKFETEEAMFNSQKKRAGDMKNVATSAVKTSRLYRELNAQTIKHLDKLHDYLGVMLDVNSAYSDRSNALLTVQTLVSEVSILSSRIEKLEAVAFKVFSGERSRIQKIDELKETLRVADDAKTCAVREYEIIKENNRAEFQRLDKERREDFFGMLKGFVVNQDFLGMLEYPGFSRPVVEPMLKTFPRPTTTEPESREMSGSAETE